MRKFPRVSHRQPDKDRTFAGAINHLLNKRAEMNLSIEGKPDAAQRILRLKVRHEMAFVEDECFGEAEIASTGTAVFTIKIDGVSAGTVTFSAGVTDAVVAITTALVPTGSVLEIFAPPSQDASLSGVTLTLSVSR